MASIVPVILLGLFLHCVSSMTENLCKIENSTLGGNFIFTISPDIYKPNTTYTVTISGFPNETMVALSASKNNTSVGTWQQNSPNCTGVSGVKNKTAEELWISPATIDNYVEIRAYVDPMGNGSYVMKKKLKKESLMSTPMNNITVAPNNATGSKMTTPMMNSTVTPMMNLTVTPMMNLTVTPMMNLTVTPMINITVTPANTANNNVTTPMMNTTVSPNMMNTSTTITTEITTRSTGNVISFKLLHVFASMLLLLMVPELL